MEIGTTERRLQRRESSMKMEILEKEDRRLMRPQRGQF
jgi:hypothetical protein